MNIAQPPIIMTDWLRELCGFDYDEFQGTFTADHPSYEYLKRAIADGQEAREGYQAYLYYYEEMEQLQAEQKNRRHLSLIKGGLK